MRNARFWVFWNDGAVKITLKPGQSLSVEVGGPTDEGWYREGITWHHEGVTVRRECADDGSDCDGRLTHYGESRCCIYGLASGNEVDGQQMPAWELTNRGQRDYQAERAGY